MLDVLMPRYHFAERHHRHIAAGADAVWDALTRVTVRDLTVTRPLLALRHPGEHATTGPLLTTGPLPLLFVEPGRYALAGTVAQPWRRHPVHRRVHDAGEVADFAEPGWAAYFTDFRIVATGHGCVLTTETRVFTIGVRARLCFAAYWALIRVPSGIVRRDVLRAIAHIAEVSPAAVASGSP